MSASLALCAVAAHGQLFSATPPAATPTPVLDASALKPPPGARVAIIEFADLECPACAAQNPLIKAAAAQYHIPWVRRDFPLPYHAWGLQASINARWFDTKSKAMGDEYRDAVFANQRNIETPDQLRAATEKFAKDRGLVIPFAVDPQNKLADLVKADQALGIRTGVHHTPTVWIVTEGAAGRFPAYAEMLDHTTLYSMLDSAIAATGGAKTTGAAKASTVAKTPAKR